jgi:hypothetical protein
MMPRPPSHWVRLRQKRIARPWLSMSIMLLAPVAVTPAMDSKNASTGEETSPPSIM